MLLFFFILSSLVGCTVQQEYPEQPTPSATSLATPTTPGLPDLTVYDVSLEINPEDECMDTSGPFRIRIQIANQGKSDAGPFSVAVNEEPLRYFSGLPAKETLELWFTGSTLQVAVTVDPLLKIAENNENNNLLTVELVLPADQALCPNTVSGDAQIINPLITLEGHTDKVLSVNFSPDGNLVASGSIDNTLRLWQISPGSLLRTMRGHPFPILAIKFSANGAILATGSTDGVLRIWRVSDGRLLQELKGHAGRVKSLDLSTDGRYLVSCADDFTIRLWRMTDYRLAQTIDEGMADITSVAFSPDNQSIAWSENDGTVRVRSISGNWLHVFSETPLSANAVAFDPLGRWLSAGFADGSIRLWDIVNGDTVLILKSQALAITDLKFSPDGNWLASASRDGTIHLFQRDENGFVTSPELILTGHIAAINSISFSPKGDLLASASDDYSVHIWEIPREE